VNNIHYIKRMRDIPLQAKVDEPRRRPPDGARLQSFFDDHRFASILRQQARRMISAAAADRRKLLRGPPMAVLIIGLVVLLGVHSIARATSALRSSAIAHLRLFGVSPLSPG
jgi:uncharacterized protein YjeT (DUF2065 family)